LKQTFNILASVRRRDVATKQRILAAAAKVFAERGYEEATIRDICRRARANVASVNYYFGNKAAVYAEVLKYGAALAIAKYPPDWGLGPHPTPQEQLHAFVRAFLYRLLHPTRVSWHGTLMAREMADPTPALDGLVRDMVKPMAERLEGLVRLWLGSRAPQTDVRLHALSIVGQCLFYRHAQPVLRRLYPEQTYTEAEIERLATHITTVASAALERTSKPADAGREMPHA